MLDSFMQSDTSSFLGPAPLKMKKNHNFEAQVFKFPEIVETKEEQEVRKMLMADPMVDPNDLIDSDETPESNQSSEFDDDEIKSQ